MELLTSLIEFIFNVFAGLTDVISYITDYLGQMLGDIVSIFESGQFVLGVFLVLLFLKLIGIIRSAL